MSRRKRQAMPGHYGKNIAQNAQRKFFERRKREKAAADRSASGTDAREAANDTDRS